MRAPHQYILTGFLLGLGFMASQDLWWLLTGMLSIGRG